MELYVLCVHLQILNHVTCIYEFQTVLLKLVSFSCLVIHIVTCNYKRDILPSSLDVVAATTLKSLGQLPLSDSHLSSLHLVRHNNYYLLNEMH